MTKSWRDVLKVHPAADLFPMMSLDELKALGEDIKKNGLRAPIVLWAENHDGDLLLLDGRNRLDAAELAGVAVVSIRSDKGGRVDINVPHRRLYGRDGGRSAIDGTSLTADPYEFVLSANVHRRHLTGEQKRELIAKVLKAQPGSSNRKIAALTKVDDKTVGAVREKLEARAEIPHVEKRQDSKGRQQPARKPEPPQAPEISYRVPATTKDMLPPKPARPPSSVTRADPTKYRNNPIEAAWLQADPDLRRQFTFIHREELTRLCMEMNKEGGGGGCTFCDKRADKVAIMIAGAQGYICNECVALSVEIIAEERTAKPVEEKEPALAEDPLEIPGFLRRDRTGALPAGA